MTLRVHSCGRGAVRATLQSKLLHFFIFYCMKEASMCKSSQETSENGQETVENANYGLVNFSESGLGRMDLGEILMIILLSMAIILLGWYYCKKKRQRRLQELNNALAVAYRPAGETINYPHRSALPIQFSGQRTAQQEPPSAPPPTPGLWDQCR